MTRDPTTGPGDRNVICRDPAPSQAGTKNPPEIGFYWARISSIVGFYLVLEMLL